MAHTSMPIGPAFTVPMPPPQHPDVQGPDYRAYIMGIDGHRFMKAEFLNNHQMMPPP